MAKSASGIAEGLSPHDLAFLEHEPDGMILINNRGPLQYALTLPLSDAVFGAPVALSENEAGTFKRASATYVGWALRESRGQDARRFRWP